LKIKVGHKKWHKIQEIQMSDMCFMGTKTIEMVGKLMGLSNDYVNLGKCTFQEYIYIEGFTVFGWLA
jgi:hypothetical protein